MPSSLSGADEVALTQIFPPTLISAQIGPVVKRWPLGADRIRFQLDDALFTNPALAVEILIQLSWDGQNGPWTYAFPVTWRGGAKSRSGDSPSVLLGRFVRNGVREAPSHVRFFARPADGSAPVTVGLLAEITEL